MREIEVLAPAGSFDTMKAAYKAGADAVYMGGPMFGARAYADNADAGQMLSAIDYAHLHGRKLYMTVNTLMDTDPFSRFLRSSDGCKIDGCCLLNGASAALSTASSASRLN